MQRSVEELVRKDLVLSFFDGEDGSKELLGVWILRFSEVMDLFYDLAMLHDDDVVAEAVCESKVMADEHVGTWVSFCRRASRSRTVFWTDTSRAEVASSQTMISGSRTEHVR